MQRYELHHPVLNDAERKTWKAYNVQRWPTIALIDPEGYVVGGLAQEDIFEQFDKAIAKLIRIHRARKTLNEKPLRFQKAPPRPGDTPLFFPGKVLADARGKRLFIADGTHHRIVITDLDGKKIAIAGTGVAGKADGLFAGAEFNDPQGM